MLPTIENYYKLGEFDKANELTELMFDRFEEELEYLMTLDDYSGYSVREEMQIDNYMLQRFSQLTNVIYPQEGLGEELQERSELIQNELTIRLQELEEANKKRIIRARF